MFECEGVESAAGSRDCGTSSGSETSATIDIMVSVGSDEPLGGKLLAHLWVRCAHNLDIGCLELMRLLFARWTSFPYARYFDRSSGRQTREEALKLVYVDKQIENHSSRAVERTLLLARVLKLPAVAPRSSHQIFLRTQSVSVSVQTE